MPSQPAVQNNFTGGLKTEYTGLNFPENACTETDNCVFTLIGDVLRREGINFEANNVLNSVGSVTGDAISYFRWLNAGGDGDSEVLVAQVGSTLYFFETDTATEASPMSANLLGSTVNISSFLANGSTNVVNAVECQYAAGNGYLFVYHPYCDPFYCTYASGTITAAIITIQIRDFAGITEPGVLVNTRPSTLSAEHNYNLFNQGWAGDPAISQTPTAATGSAGVSAVPSSGTSILTIASGLSISNGEAVTISGYGIWSGNGHGGGFTAFGTVTNYSGSTLTIAVSSASFTSGFIADIFVYTQPVVRSVNSGVMTTWFNDIGNYPSNSDQWWEFKDDTNTFNPTSTIGNVTSDAGQAPQGFYVLNAFNQDRTSTSGIAGLTPVTTVARPRTGTWFQGRVWYAGVDASQAATGDAQFYTWTENIYFSQVVTTVTDFAQCYENNDPTSENLFDLLPTDGGVIQIQGCGSIYKLFAIQNGVLVFAANGVWFITGSSGIGFTANDYTITKISSVQSISSTSFIDVMGLPFFWNEEGIYRVSPSQGQGIGLAVEPLTIGTILSFYNDIPLDSKRFVRGDYDPINYVVSWVYRSTQETSVTTRYQFDSVMSLNIFNKAFYPYTISSNNACFVGGLFYMNYPTGTLDPQFKYITIVNNQLTFAEENDSTTWLDWFAYDGVGVDYTSYFMTGYRLEGKALRKFSPLYVTMFSRNDVPTAYTIQGVWDYANSGNSGRYTTQQLVYNSIADFGMVFRRHKIRGHGTALQLYVSSVTGMPFDIMGWTKWTNIDGGI